jgi:hypothetical protein
MSGNPVAPEMQFVETVRTAARKHILYLPHAIDQMNASDEMITTEEVRAVIFDGEIIEDYAEDARGHSCLMLGHSPGIKRPIHIVCSPKDEYLAIITAYLPDPAKWSPDFRKRVEKPL